MNLTEEQIAIVQSEGNIKINAVAGSGKTTTIIEYARSRNPKSRILYLAFNRSVKLEAEFRFKRKGLHNVRVETAHSLAYKHIVFRHKYKVRPQGYQTHEVTELLGITGNGEKHAQYITANHILGLVACYCNSDKMTPEEVDYLGTVTEPKSKAYAVAAIKYITSQAKVLLSRMDKGEIEVTHDFYLKKYQLSKPKLAYEYILFDEGQDASAAMLDVFLRQQATKVIVGDTHQQIYGWRHAVNSLQKADFSAYQLSASFRFGPDIASLASEILMRKNYLQPHTRVEIQGLGNAGTIRSKAVIGRTNLGLLLKAIEFVTEGKNLRHLYFEGNFSSYTYADEGASLYDVLHLFNGRRQQIRDQLIQSMRNMNELEEYIKKTDDSQLAMMVEIVKEYGNQIPGILKSIKERHVDDDEKERAEIIFSTVHRCKGMEYDEVHLVNDFLMESSLKKLAEEMEETDPGKARLLEEINLLYVAATRAKYVLHIPDGLIPEGLQSSASIVVVRKAEAEEKSTDRPHSARNTQLVQRGNRLIEEGELPAWERVLTMPKKKEYPNDDLPWTDEQDAELISLFDKGNKLAFISDHFGRSGRAVEKRVKALLVS